MKRGELRGLRESCEILETIAAEIAAQVDDPPEGD